ncbi:hypothetical protein A0H81_11712 [Grifola frondosa]|uniref:Uncharacterized protein n=1 Tax=Grifola frondosa TaxID=5627 RepID=A0A1C7LUZ3_GRIFR|nr:hypothetical protein A0H81_11712 [Grifola frondosa]
MEIEADLPGDRKIFWLWREIGMKSSVKEPFTWQLIEMSYVRMKGSEDGKPTWHNTLAGKMVLLGRARSAMWAVL